jgi:Protein of unknown function (DUF3592)
MGGLERVGQMVQKKASRPSWKVPLFFAVLCLSYAGWALGEFVMFELKAERVSATVESAHREAMRGRRGSVSVYRPVVTFLVPGSTLPVTATTTTAASSFDYAKGRQVMVEYDPANPVHTARIDSGVWGFDWLDLVIGVGGVAILVYAVEQLRQDFKKKAAK